MTGQMGIVEILGLAASVSLLSGWRLYLCVLATGLAMHFDMLPLPEHLAALKVLASPWVMGAAGLAAFVEFFADKIAWLDSAWDTLHTVIRPLGGALLALAVVDPADPATQAIAFSNVVVSTAEDVVAGGLLVLAYTYPAAAGVMALALLALTIWLLLLARRVLKRIFGARAPGKP